MENEIVKLTKEWIERFVIGLRLCPFAHFSFYKNTIFYDVSNHKKKHDCLLDLMEMVMKMNSVNKESISNAFLVFDKALTFDFMLKLKANLDSKLMQEELDGVFQSVVFHPEFQFADEDVHGSGNFTNRSPLPMMHILREDEVANAILLTENVEEIPFRNKEVLERLNIKNISEVFEQNFMDRIQQYI